MAEEVRRDGLRPVELSGVIDARGHEALRLTLSEAINDGASEVAVDLRDVAFLDSGAAKILLQAKEAARARGRTLRVVGPGKDVRLLLEAFGAWVPLTGDGEDPVRWTTERIVRVRAQQHQLQIDNELRETRRRLLTLLWRQLHTDPTAFADVEFLALADAKTMADGILMGVTAAGARAGDLQRYDDASGSLYIARQRGFTDEFLEHFAVVDPDTPSACATALVRGEPVLVDDVGTSAIFAGQPSREVMLAAGSRAVQTFPLHDGGGALLGTLSFHYGVPHPRAERAGLVAVAAARALEHLATR